jgi:hypothetical protein
VTLSDIKKIVVGLLVKVPSVSYKSASNFP